MTSASDRGHERRFGAVISRNPDRVGSLWKNWPWNPPHPTHCVSGEERQAVLITGTAAVCCWVQATEVFCREFLDGSTWVLLILMECHYASCWSGNNASRCKGSWVSSNCEL